MTGWILKRGEREVPIPDDATLRKWADEHRFNPGDLIFHPVLQRWLYAQDVLEIRGSFDKVTGASSVAAGRDSSSNGGPQSAETQNSDSDFIIRHGGQDFRAPDAKTLRLWADQGRIPPESYVFHPLLKKWSYARDLAELESAYQQRSSLAGLATSYRSLVVWVGLQILVAIGLWLFTSLSLILVPFLLVTIVALAYYAFRTAEALGSSGAPLWAVGMLVPCINIITLLVLSSQATAMCRDNGIEVGFLGPRL